MRQRILWTLLLSASCAGVVLLLLGLGAFESLELKSLDARVRLASGARKPSRDVVLVDIDDKSLAAYHEAGLQWEWPRGHLAALVDFLGRAGAKVIAFDHDLSAPDRLHPREDAALAAAMRKAGNVVLSGYSTANKILTEPDNALVRGPELGAPARLTLLELGPDEHGILPVADFQANALALGIKNNGIDPDGVCRRQHLIFSMAGREFPQFSLAAFMAFRRIRVFAPPRGGVLSVGNTDIPLVGRGSFQIFWYGPTQGAGSVFRHYSFADLVAPGPRVLSRVPASDFAGKAVIVGLTARSHSFYVKTPFTEDINSDAAEVHATLLSNFLQRDLLRRAPAAWTAAAVFLAALLVCFPLFFGPSVLSAGLLACAGAAVWLFLAQHLLASRLLWLDVVPVLAALLLAFGGAAAASYALEGRARRRLRETFSRYLSPVVISEVLDRGEQVSLGGMELTGTVLFTDLRGFTSLSERMSPREVVAFLNEYFSLVSEVILEHGGLVDKYIGDAVMAVFGAPLPDPRHAEKACAAALEIQRLLASPPSGPARPEWHTRIGLHSGAMVVGNIGTARRLEYTAIGDTVNLASRLEGANKLYGSRILLSEAARALAGGAFETRELDLLAPKGKSEALRVHELLARRGELGPQELARRDSFEKGVRLYRARSFGHALGLFEAIRAQTPDDAAAQLYIERSRKCLDSPPPEGWDGVFRLA